MMATIPVRIKSLFLLAVYTSAAVMLAVPIYAQHTTPAAAADKQPKASYVGSDGCKGCHGKIGEEFAKNPHAVTLSQSPSDEYKGCESCHGPGSIHVSAPSANKLPVSGSTLDESCSRCHLTGNDAPKDWQKIEAKHWRRGEHSRAGTSCTSCHKVHANSPKLVTKQAPELCITCHAKVLQENGKKATYTHAPVAGGMCLKCHNPHGTSSRHNVVANIQQVCAGCHKPGTAEMAKAHGGMNITDSNCASCHSTHSHNKQAKLIKANQHMPFKSHQCGTCHKANSTELLKPERDLCTTCHSKDLAADPKDGSHMHAAVKQGMCSGCHNPHASDASKAYRKEEKIAYACFKCHSSVEYQTLGKHQHKPLENLNCISCHKPHTSKESNLLVKSESDLCGQCHKEHNLLHPMVKKADGKPVIDPLRKDTLTCTSCHTPHGGQFERMAVRDYTRDLCTGCHSVLH